MHALVLLLLFPKAFHIAKGRPALPTYLPAAAAMLASTAFEARCLICLTQLAHTLLQTGLGTAHSGRGAYI